MKKLAALIAVGMLLGSTVAYAAAPEPRGKLMMLTSTNTTSSGPDLEVLVNFTDFNSMTECTNAIYILTQPNSTTININGVIVRGQILPNKVGTYGNEINYTYRCIPFGYSNLY